MARYPLPCPYCGQGPFSRQALDAHLETCEARKDFLNKGSTVRDVEKAREMGRTAKREVEHDLGYRYGSSFDSVAYSKAIGSVEDFGKDLEKFLPDEEQATKDYATRSDKAKALKLDEVAETLKGMSNDEHRHHGNLEKMIAICKNWHPNPGNPSSSSEKKRKFTIHGREYWFSKDELPGEFGLEPDETDEIWESGELE